MERSAQGIFLAKRIIDGKLTYTKVKESRPDLILEIDQYLIDNGYEHLIERDVEHLPLSINEVEEVVEPQPKETKGRRSKKK